MIDERFHAFKCLPPREHEAMQFVRCRLFLLYCDADRGKNKAQLFGTGNRGLIGTIRIWAKSPAQGSRHAFQRRWNGEEQLSPGFAGMHDHAWPPEVPHKIGDTPKPVTLLQ